MLQTNIKKQILSIFTIMKIVRFFFIQVLISLSVVTNAQSIEKIKITDLEKILQKTDSTYIINFWATFCAPCIEEMADLIKYTKKYEKQKVKLIFVSLDLAEAYPSQILEFVTKKKLSDTVVWLNETDADYFCPKIDTLWTGTIPATIIVNNKIGYKKFFEKKLSAKEIKTMITQALVK
jgi:thiol-disulfide isomerase/thioredoxin